MIGSMSSGTRPVSANACFVSFVRCGVHVASSYQTPAPP
jgi:hypothetical protein